MHMPKLRRLEVIGCEMVRFHQMAPFYRDIAKIQKTRGMMINVDISPLCETGTRWENRTGSSPVRDDRSGEYVVCWADVGVKIPSAVAVELYWQLFPAMLGQPSKYSYETRNQGHNVLTFASFSEAGQWETIFDLSSAARQYLERLPMPNMAVPILIRIFSDNVDVKKDIERAEAKWATEHPAPSSAPTGGNAQGNARGNRRQRTKPEARATPNPCPGIYNPHYWPSALRRKVTEFMVKRNHALAFAMFGAERWIETADRNEMSTDTQCRTDNYGIWGVDKKCYQCEIHLPMIAFTGGGLCENCRLKNACEDEDDHLKESKKKATQALGFNTLPTAFDEPQNAQMGTQNGQMATLSVQASNQDIPAEVEDDDEQSYIFLHDITRSNFPKPEAFWKMDDEGKRVSLVNCPSDLARILSDPESSLVEFFLEALALDMSEAKYGPIGRIGFKQKKHPSGDHLRLGMSSRQMAGHYMYRQCLSVEDFVKRPYGLTANDVRRLRGGF